MAINNTEIAQTFEELADLLEINDDNPFRVRSYRTAAQNIRSMGHSLSTMVENGDDLTRIPGIGNEIAQKIQHLVEAGELEALNRLYDELPQSLTTLVKVEGLGPKRVKTLYNELGIETIDELKKALQEHKVQQLTGFGEQTEKNIQKALERFESLGSRHSRYDVIGIVDELLHYLKQGPESKAVEVAGSFRRCKETVGDIDILAARSNGRKLADYFIDFPKVENIISHGDTRSSVRLQNGLQVDLRVVEPDSYGAALHYFTGSKEHNLAVRQMARKHDLKINEYGVYRDNKPIAGTTEQQIYELFDMDFVPPELRENQGEIEAALEHRLPDLLAIDDIKGDLHSHTNATDGQADLATMAQTAADKGYQYLGITDHTKRLTVAKGQDEKRLEQQIHQIDELNKQYNRFRILKGAEVDILENGDLDLEDWVLEKLDFTVCSVHHKFNLDKDKQTKRVVAAMKHPCFSILGHPTGRQINKRQAFELDMEKVLASAAEHNKIVEVNAQPERLDLNAPHCRLAKEMGVKLAINTDAHLPSNLAYMRFGVEQARRGWIEADDVINTFGLDELLKHL